MLTKTGNGETWQLTYNALNQVTGADITRPSGATDVKYVYDHDGIRVGKTVNNTDVTRYVVDKNRPYAQVLEEQRYVGNANATTISYVYGDTLLSQATGPSTGSGQASIPHYYLYDGMHSVRALADSAGTLTDAYTYDAYGNLLDNSGPTINPYLYRGEQYDENLDAYYLRARYYQPGVGRFMSTDPVEGFPNSPITLHRYVYAGGNPINCIDPSGKLSLQDVLITSTIALGISAAGCELGYCDAFHGFYEGLATWVPDAGVIGFSAFGAWQAIQSFKFLVDLIGGMLGGSPVAFPNNSLEINEGVIVGVDVLFSFSSAEIGVLWHEGYQAEAGYIQADKKLPADVHVTGYQDWIWNLWNTNNYTGPFVGLSVGGPRNAGFSLFCDAKNYLRGPYGIAFPFVNFTLSKFFFGMNPQRNTMFSISLAHSLWRHPPIHVEPFESSAQVAKLMTAAQFYVMLFSAAQGIAGQGNFSFVTSAAGLAGIGWIAQSKRIWNQRHPEHDVKIRQTMDREEHADDFQGAHIGNFGSFITSF